MSNNGYDVIYDYSLSYKMGPFEADYTGQLRADLVPKVYDYNLSG